LKELLQLRDGDPNGIAPHPQRRTAAEDFGTFYRAEMTDLVVLGCALAGPALAEDVAQEAMLTVFRRWSDLGDGASRVYAARCACLTQALTVAQRRSRERLVLRGLGRFRSLPVDGSEHDQFWAAVRNLPLNQAQSCALHYGLGLSEAEVAITQGSDEDTVKSRLSRARAALAQTWDVRADDAAIDTEAHRLSTSIRHVAARTFDLEAGLALLRTVAVRRQRLRVLTFLALIATLVFGIAYVFPTSAEVGLKPPDPAMRQLPLGASYGSAPPCGAPPVVRCIGPATFVIDAGRMAFALEVPDGFSKLLERQDAPYSIEFDQSSAERHAGVSILLDVRAATRTNESRSDAKGLAEWVRSRPFLDAAEPTATSVAGRTGWKVETRWALGVEQPRLAESCNRSEQQCLPVLRYLRRGQNGEIGISKSMVGSYTFFNVSKHQVAVLWSWAFEDDTEALAVNDRLIQSISLKAS
jgi:RNA polymerase sigma-70 factor, ECF subfamily